MNKDDYGMNNTPQTDESCIQNLKAFGKYKYLHITSENTRTHYVQFSITEMKLTQTYKNADHLSEYFFKGCCDVVT